MNFATCFRHSLRATRHRVRSLLEAIRPQTNGKEEHVIRKPNGHSVYTVQISFKNSVNRHIQLFCFINFYNAVKSHKGLNNAIP